MTFLKKLGQLALQITGIVLGLQEPIGNGQPAPALSPAVSDLLKIAQVIVSVEIAGQALNLAGPDKLKAAIPLVAQILSGSSFMAGHNISDPALYQVGIANIAAGMANILNSIHDKDADMVATNKV